MRRKSRGNSLSPYELESGRGRSPGFDKMGRPEPSPPMSRSPSPPRGKKDRFGGLMNLLSLVLSPAWVQTFVMTFLGEWGDRSQIATIAMAAGQDYWWITGGAVIGHAMCTALAVIGGRAIAGRVSMRIGTKVFSYLRFSLLTRYFSHAWWSRCIPCLQHHLFCRFILLRISLFIIKGLLERTFSTLF